MATKLESSTGIKGLYFNKMQGYYTVYKYIDGERIEFGKRRDRDKALLLHATAYPSLPEKNFK